MKWLLYIFLLANLATFFWHYQPDLFRSSMSQPAQQNPDADEVPQLVLLKEYQSKRPAAQGNVSSSTTASCFNLGPFTHRQDARQVSQELTKQGVSVSLHVAKDKTRPGYWVLIPASKDRQAARKIIARLKQKKVRDYFLVATGSQKNAISLGVFSRPDLAQKQLEMIKKLGFTVTISKVDLPKREYWLEWPAATQAKVGTVQLDKWHKRYPGIGSTRVVCHEMP